MSRKTLEEQIKKLVMESSAMPEFRRTLVEVDFSELELRAAAGLMDDDLCDCGHKINSPACAADSHSKVR